MSSSTNGLKALENDPKIGANTLNYLTKWNGTSVVKSISIFEDTNGNVGIGTETPVGPLEVKFPVFTETTIEQTVWTQFSPYSTDIWQTFYLAEGGFITSIDLSTGISGPVTISIYFGYGTVDNAALVYTETITSPFNASMTSPWVLSNPWNLTGGGGNYFTIRIESATGGYFGDNNTDAYPNGESNLGPGHDYLFRVTIDEPLGPEQALLINSSGDIGIGRAAMTNRFEVEGEASKTTAGSWIGNSDARLKKDIKALNSQDMLDQLLALQGVTYKWNDDKTGSKRPKGIQYGFIAQNIQEVFPSLVAEDNLGYLQTAYGTYDVMTVEAIRALYLKIEVLESENKTLKTQVYLMQSKSDEMDKIKERMTQLERLLVNPGSASIIAVEK